MDHGKGFSLVHPQAVLGSSLPSRISVVKKMAVVDIGFGCLFGHERGSYYRCIGIKEGVVDWLWIAMHEGRNSAHAVETLQSMSMGWAFAL